MQRRTPFRALWKSAIVRLCVPSEIQPHVTYLRFAFCKKMDVIDEAVERLQKLNR